MRVLVTGGAGFIGSHTVDRLCAEGHEVAVVDDLSSGRREYLHDDAAFHELDIRSDELGNVFASFKPTHLIHLAAQMDVRISLERPRHDADVNVLGTINLLEECREHQVEGFVFASTGGAVYGDPPELPVSEEVPARPQCQYGVSKFCAEQYIRLYHDLYGLRYCILRYGNVYGPRQDPHGEAGVCAIFTEQLLDGRTPVLFGFGKPVRDYVHVADVVDANLLALRHTQGSTLNIASGQGSSVREVFDIIREHADAESEPDLQPLRPGEIDRIYLANDRALEELGWRPQTELQSGLGSLVGYMRERRG